MNFREYLNETTIVNENRDILFSIITDLIFVIDLTNQKPKISEKTINKLWDTYSAVGETKDALKIIKLAEKWLKSNEEVIIINGIEAKQVAGIKADLKRYIKYLYGKGS